MIGSVTISFEQSCNYRICPLRFNKFYAVPLVNHKTNSDSTRGIKTGLSCLNKSQGQEFIFCFLK